MDVQSKAVPIGIFAGRVPAIRACSGFRRNRFAFSGRSALGV